MLCSTVIPTINRPSFERALKTALAQDLAPDDHEIIVVNDSGRPLPDVDWLQSPRITIVNTNRCERSVACNAGAAVARGRYLKILQDDDYLLPGALKALIDVAEATGALWVYGAFNRVDDDDAFMSEQQPEVRGNLFAHSVVGDCFHLSVSLLRRDVFFALGGFDPLINTSEDIDLQARISRIGDIEYTTHRVAHIRVGPSGSTSTQWQKKTADTRKVREKVLDQPGTFARVRASLGDDVRLAGRCCRAYGISALLNARGGRLVRTVDRLGPATWLALRYGLSGAFWQGLIMRSHWHVNEKAREEGHYAVHHPEKFKPQSW
jgi:GT2 family glycosyltransferase